MLQNGDEDGKTVFTPGKAVSDAMFYFRHPGDLSAEALA
jgi:hypothetical protein